MLIDIYGRNGCRYCDLALEAVKAKNIEYRYHNLDKEEWTVVEMTELLGYRPKTVPLIFIDGEFIGGYSEMADRVKKRK